MHRSDELGNGLATTPASPVEFELAMAELIIALPLAIALLPPLSPLPDAGVFTTTPPLARGGWKDEDDAFAAVV